ncbi:hypothetical protein DL93DRAFT_2153391 [Clavulina sp. PMI_390]|nr:hypothetical protein DL93DRAFT_2153391 [Clavulina sp. PMI_390]
MNALLRNRLIADLFVKWCQQAKTGYTVQFNDKTAETNSAQDIHDNTLAGLWDYAARQKFDVTAMKNCRLVLSAENVDLNASIGNEPGHVDGGPWLTYNPVQLFYTEGNDSFVIGRGTKVEALGSALSEFGWSAGPDGWLLNEEQMALSMGSSWARLPSATKLWRLMELSRSCCPIALGFQSRVPGRNHAWNDYIGPIEKLLSLGGLGPDALEYKE